MRFLPVLALAIAAGCESTSGGREPPPPPPPPVSVHYRSPLDDSLDTVRRGLERQDNGGLAVEVEFRSYSSKDLPLLVRTVWYDERGGVVDESDWRPELLPSQGDVLYEAFTLDARAVSCRVLVRRASTHRR